MKWGQLKRRMEELDLSDDAEVLIEDGNSERFGIGTIDLDGDGIEDDYVVIETGDSRDG